MDALMQAAQPIAPAQRADFLRDVAARFAGRADIGDGELHRILREVQRRHFDPPHTGWGPAPLHNRRRA